MNESGETKRDFNENESSSRMTSVEIRKRGGRSNKVRLRGNLLEVQKANVELESF